MPRVKILLNDAKSGEPREFLSEAGKKVGLKDAQFAYLSTGQEVRPNMLQDLEDDAEVFVSEKEGFFRSSVRPGNYKLALLGVGGVGKSCIVLKYIKGAFTEVYDPSIEDAFRHHVTCDDIPCILEVLDTAGQEEYKCIAQQWVKKKHGFIIVYSITDDASFGHLKPFYDLILDEYVNTEEEGAEVKPPPIVLVGNKLDLASERKVPTAQGQALAAQWGAGFFEVSAKTNENIENAFHALIRMMRQQGAVASSGALSTSAGSSAGGSGARGSSNRGGGLFGCVLL